MNYSFLNSHRTKRAQTKYKKPLVSEKNNRQGFLIRYQMSVNGSRQENQHGGTNCLFTFFLLSKKQILLTVSKKQILLTVSKKQIFCVSIVSTLLLLAIFPLAKNRHPLRACVFQILQHRFKLKMHQSGCCTRST